MLGLSAALLLLLCISSCALAGALYRSTATRSLSLLQPLVSEASVRWAACTLLSRAFSLDLQAPPSEGDNGEERGDAEGRWDAGGASSSDQDSLALVPWADMLCHSSEAGARQGESLSSGVGADV